MKINKMRFNFSKLDQPIIISELKQVTENGVPMKPRPVTFLECFAHVETSSLKDYQTSMQSGTKSYTKIFVRNYPGITNKMQIKHNGNDYNVKDVLYDYRSSGYSVLISEWIDHL